MFYLNRSRLSTGLLKSGYYFDAARYPQVYQEATCTAQPAILSGSLPCILLFIYTKVMSNIFDIVFILNNLWKHNFTNFIGIQ